MAGRAAELADAKDLGFRKWRFFNVPNRSFELRLWPMFTGLKCTFTFPESVCQGREIPTSKVAQKWHRPPYMAALRPPRAGVRSPAICPCRLAPCRVCATRRAWGVFLVATGVRARSGANATPGAKARFRPCHLWAGRFPARPLAWWPILDNSCGAFALAISGRALESRGWWVRQSLF